MREEDDIDLMVSQNAIPSKLMKGFINSFGHLHETNAEARGLEERIAEDVVKLLEGADGKYFCNE